MRKILCLCLLILLLPLPVLAEDISYTVFYVATTGSDTNDGSFQAPFATLNRAINAAAGKENAIIKMRGGRYQMTSTVSLNANHSGLTIENYRDEQVILSGATLFPYSKFKKVTDQAILNRIIEQNGKDRVVYASLEELGISDPGTMKLQGFSGNNRGYSPILVWKDTLMKYAQYPNDGYLYTKTVIKANDTSNQYNGLTANQFTVNSDRPSLWKNAPDIWSLGFIKHDWADFTTPTYLQEDGSIITYAHSSYPAESGGNRRIRFFNLLEELDAPGEFYIDRENNIMYLIPPEGIEQQDTFHYTTYNNRLFSLSRANDVTIRNICLEGTLSNAVYASNCNSFVIDNCEFSAIGNTAVTFSSCLNSGIKNSYLHELSSCGVAFYHSSSRRTLTNTNCFMTNCNMKTFSQYKRTGIAGVDIGAVGVRVAHNEFSDSPYIVIWYKSNECVIEYNEFYNVCNDSSDSGIIYAGRDWTTRGNHIRYNYFHDLKAIATTTGMKMQAVYLDDMHAATQVYGNVFHNISAVALYGGGRYNTFENNLMLECEYPFRFDSRGLDWMDSGNGSQIRSKLNSVPYTTGIWAETYPELVGILKDEPEKPKHNTIRNNVRYKTKPLNIDQVVKDTGMVEDAIHITNTDSFVDYKNKNFNLKENSEIKKQIPDWKDIPFDNIGRYEVTKEERDERPVATNVKIKGTGISGQPLTADYTYQGKGFPEGNTVFTWYILEGNSYRVIQGANKSTYTPILSQRGKQIRVTVTPVNVEGTSGTPVRSTVITVTRPCASEILTATKTDNSITVTNSDSREVSVTAVYPTYQTVGLTKLLINSIVESKTIPTGGMVTFPWKEELILFCTDSLEPVTIGGPK